MNKVVIIGGGFAGLTALSRLSNQKGLELVLIDKKQTFDFLPCLPDILSQRIHPDNLILSLDRACKKHRAKFINSQVLNIDTEKRIIKTSGQEVDYDYLLIASGSETNFYGNRLLQEQAYKLDTVADAETILKALDRGRFRNFVISGAGYTGIEIATNIRRKEPSKKIIIVEKAPSILGPLPSWMKDYVSENLKRLNIEVALNSAVEGIKDNRVNLSGGRSLEGAMLIWSAGVKVSDYIFKLQVEKSNQGRVSVDHDLRAGRNYFIVGDTASVIYKDMPLRMGVQFSIAQGDLAAVNILRSIKGKPLKVYKPVDLGYVVPMANNRSCGKILGINVRGLLSTALHYFMCVYRTYGFKNKFGMIKCLLKGGKV